MLNHVSKMGPLEIDDPFTFHHAVTYNRTLYSGSGEDKLSNPFRDSTMSSRFLQETILPFLL